MSPSNNLRARTVALIATVALSTTGCAALDDDAGSSKDISVAAGFYPLAWLSEKIAGEHAEVHNLTRPGQDAHDGELALADTARLADASLVVISRGFQPGVDDSADQNASGPVLDAAELLTFRTADKHGYGHDDHSDHDHADHDHGDHAGHDHGDLDPHFWLDPLLMADLGDAIAAEMADLAPDHAEDFSEAAVALREELTELDSSYAEGLASCEQSTVVVSHDAFGYLTRYGLRFEPIAGLSPGAEPTPADLNRLHALIEEEGITTVFNETLAPATLAEQVAKDRGIETAVLDPVEGLTDTTVDEDYISLMEQNLATLQKANGC